MSSAGRAGGQIYIIILIFITFKQISFKKHLKYRSSWRQLCPVQAELEGKSASDTLRNDFPPHTELLHKTLTNINKYFQIRAKVLTSLHLLFVCWLDGLAFCRKEVLS